MASRMLMPFRQLNINDTFVSGGKVFIKISSSHARVVGTNQEIYIAGNVIVELA